MRYWWLGLLAFGLILSGCLKAIQKEEPQAAVQEEVQNPKRLLGTLTLSTPKTSYAVGEAIPLELELKVGKFDLLTARRYVVGDGAFVNLSVTEAGGSQPQPKQIIQISQATESLYYEGKRVKAIPGLELPAGSVHKASLKDLTDLYDLGPGTYQVQVKLRIPVYHEPKIPRQSPAIAQLQEEIVLLQRDPKLSAGAKADAIATLKQQIQELQAKQPPGEREYYVDTGKLRGYADFESNVLTITVR